MPHPVQVQKIVLLPRFTTFSGARTFQTAPINVREFASADFVAWIGNGVGTTPSLTIDIEESTDLTIWTTLTTLNPMAETETEASVGFGKEWIRLSVTLLGTNPGFTGWCVGDFVTRVPRGN